MSSQGDGFIRNGAISRYPILTETTYDDGLRGLHAFRVQIRGTDQLQVYHAHLKCCADDCTRKQTEAQFDSDVIKSVAATDSTPYIFGGDWNEDEEKQPPVCTLTSTYHPISTIRTNGNFVDFKPTTLSGEHRTWSTTSASIRFDYLLAASNRLSAVSGYVFSTMDWAAHGLYTDAGPQNLVNDSQTASDHFCVFAKYFFPSPGFPVTPTNAFASAGYLGGPFSPAQQIYTLSNTNVIPLHWGVTKSASWLTISATNGILAGGASTNIVVSVNAAASTLPVGNYPDTIGFVSTTINASLTIIWPPPVANFSGSPTNGIEPVTVTFTDTSTGPIANRFWNFGDGGTTNVTTNSVVHTYSAGSYDVTLIATGPGGVSTNTQPIYINVLSAFQNWAIPYFGRTTNPAAAANADPDGDGQDNMAEFLAGTDPTNSASAFRITSIMTEGGAVRVTWRTAGGKTNIVQAGIGDLDNNNDPIYGNQFYDMSDPIIVPGSGDTETTYLRYNKRGGD